MADNMDDNIKKAKAYKESLDAINKSIDLQTKTVGLLADEMGIAFSAFQSQTKKTQEDRLKELKLLNDAKKSIQGQKAALAEAFNEALNLDGAFKKIKSSAAVFSGALASIDASKLSQEFSGIEDVQQRMNELLKKQGELSEDQASEFKELKKLHDKYMKDTKEFNKDNEEFFKDWLKTNKEIDDILDSLPFDTISDKMEFIKKLRDGDLSAAEQILSTDQLDAKSKQKLLGLTENLSESQKHVNDLQAEASNEMKTQTSLAKNLWNVVKSNSENAFRSIWGHMKDTNQAFKDAQKDFGLMFGGDGASYKDMAMLTSEAAKFNMSTKDTLQMMGQLGEELKTTDTQYLASATEHFLAVQKATGISSEEVTTIAGEMMRAGKSAQDVETYMEGSNKMAKLFNVNTKKVLQGVARNIDKMRQMGFQGGEESLTRMVATAERLKMNVDEIFDVAKRARTIEGAMEMASELQLAGGSFANINPMDLLSAARKGPEELQKILTSMGDDIGSWNKETGEFQFDPVDVDRLQMVADATGQSLDSIQKMIQSNAEDARKAEFMPDLQLGEVMGPDGKPLDQDMMNNMLKDSLDVHGEILEGSMLDKAGVKDIKDLTSEQAQSIIEDHMNKQATLEEQAKQNQSFSDTIDAFKNTIMNLFTVFQPFIEILNEVLQWMIEAGPVTKYLAAALIGFVAVAPMLGKAMEGFKAMKGLFGGAKSMLGMGKKGATDIAANKNAVPGADSKDPTAQAKGQGGGLKGLAEGLKAMGGKGVLKGIANTALAGPALLLLLPGMPTVLLMAAVGALAPLITAGFNALAQGISAMGNAKGLLKGALAMVLIGASLIPFAFALSMMTDVNWEGVLAGLVFMLAAVGIVALLGAIMMSGVGAVAILAGAAAMLIVSAAFLVFAIALQQLVPAAEGLSKVGFGWMIDLGIAMALAGPLLMIGGIMLGMAAPSLLLGALALAPMIDVLAKAATVDWSVFSGMATALYTISGALLAFGAASLAGGIMGAIGGLLGGGGPLATLETLAEIAIEAAAPLMMMSEAIDGLADGLSKLEAASAALDLEKLEMLRSLAWSMAIGAIGGGLMGDSINKIAEALAKLAKIGEGGGGGGTKKIQIDLKLNGRDIQSVIVDDTSIVS